MKVKSDLLKLFFGVFLATNITQVASAQNYQSTNSDFDNRPSLGQVPNQDGNLQDIILGGFSGLYFEGFNGNNLRFVTHPDRGPLPLPLPALQPEILRFELDPTNNNITIIDRINLVQSDGTTPLSVRPNLQAGAQGTAYTDQVATDLSGNLIPNDPFGADLEGIVIDERDNSFWMVDEYRPAIYHFDQGGTLIDRFIPMGTAAAGGQTPGTFGREIIPSVYAQRRVNRGFEAVALNQDANTLYAFIQSPIDNPDDTGDTTSRSSDILRILELNITDPMNPLVSGEFVYLLENDLFDTNVDRIGDAVWLGGNKFGVIQRDGEFGLEANKLVFEIDLSDATNLETDVFNLIPGKTLEEHTAAELVTAGITPVDKKLLFNLPDLGYVAGDKPEGLALIPGGKYPSFVVINDNDFGLSDDSIPGDGRQDFNPNPIPVVVGVITPVPEPSNHALLGGLLLLGIGSISRRYLR
ncbi:esterase-like activity of phytase family protein [Crocosphaera sp.]|uniref:esterase-like activity of phytase family protein n=1 Tax=Crocosphaera sp. TaxID=2729996 RepID=UPI002635F69A|nr:esterase-like activity of phytase family protein [Crocosphaera sp.]MDJ0578742.1 esterase-like activity of phytase family protein [Crocosphaera sp.]